MNLEYSHIENIVYFKDKEETLYRRISGGIWEVQEDLGQKFGWVIVSTKEGKYHKLEQEYKRLIQTTESPDVDLL